MPKRQGGNGCCSRAAYRLYNLRVVESKIFQPQNLAVIGHDDAPPYIDVVLEHAPICYRKYPGVQSQRCHCSIMSEKVFNLPGAGVQFHAEYSNRTDDQPTPRSLALLGRREQLLL